MKIQGEIAEAKVLAAFASKGEKVLIPWGDSMRYDLVLDRGGRFVRVQVKTGVFKHGVIDFPTSSTNLIHGMWKHNNYRGEIDFFAVVVPKLKKMYMVPVDKVPFTSAYLRVEPPKNGQKKFVNLAEQYFYSDI